MAGVTIERAAHPGAAAISGNAIFPVSSRLVAGVAAAMEGVIEAASREASN